MQANQLIRALFIFFIIGANVSCDQITKNMVRENISFSERIMFMDNNLMLTKVENRGAFFGLGENLPPVVKDVLLSGIPVLALCVILGMVFIRTNLPGQAVFGLCCVIGGGIGNIFDRIAYGSVTDFLHIDTGLFRTGIFNMADVSILLGMLLILTSYVNHPATTDTSAT